jgi:cytochrome o ubiquinol oxidase subunit III
VGEVSFWCALIGFYVTFVPLYVAGLLGMTRRLQHYEVAAWRPWVLIAGLGVIILLIGAIAQVIQLVVSVRQRDALRDETGDPWGIVLFSCLFAAHAVLQTAIADGPAGHELFKPTNIAIETACLLLSSFTCGMSAVACGVRNLLWTQVALLVTGLLGVAFLVLEAKDFAELVEQGFGPQRSAFLSSFFAVVGCHGLHVSAGLLWLGTMMAQIFVKGFRADILRRMLCFNLFWHVLDIIWVALFTIVYLIGEGR